MSCRAECSDQARGPARGFEFEFEDDSGCIGSRGVDPRGLESGYADPWWRVAATLMGEPFSAAFRPEAMLRAAEVSLGALIGQRLQAHVHSFAPQGTSLWAHTERGWLVIHTWPEHGAASLDLVFSPLDPSADWIGEIARSVAGRLGLELSELCWLESAL